MAIVNGKSFIQLNDKSSSRLKQVFALAFLDYSETSSLLISATCAGQLAAVPWRDCHPPVERAWAVVQRLRRSGADPNGSQRKQ